MRRITAIRILAAFCLLVSITAAIVLYLGFRYVEQELVTKTKEEVETAEFMDDLEGLKELTLKASLAVVASVEALGRTIAVVNVIFAILSAALLCILVIAFRIRS